MLRNLLIAFSTVHLLIWNFNTSMPFEYLKFKT